MPTCSGQERIIPSLLVQHDYLQSENTLTVIYGAEESDETVCRRIHYILCQADSQDTELTGSLHSEAAF